ncbi:hypothetical protein SAMN03159288_04667 [Rhizobium sp. NFACC06-2]|nr:hypothetical protein SAMN03159288_04667 [Rhizobium sp. NFACC06-2]
MEHFGEDYVGRLGLTRHSIARVFLADALLVAVVLGLGLTLNSVAA